MDSLRCCTSTCNRFDFLRVPLVLVRLPYSIIYCLCIYSYIGVLARRAAVRPRRARRGRRRGRGARRTADTLPVQLHCPLPPRSGLHCARCGRTLYFYGANKQYILRDAQYITYSTNDVRTQNGILFSLLIKWSKYRIVLLFFRWLRRRISLSIIIHIILIWSLAHADRVFEYSINYINYCKFPSTCKTDVWIRFCSTGLA